MLPMVNMRELLLLGLALPSVAAISRPVISLAGLAQLPGALDCRSTRNMLRATTNGAGSGISRNRQRISGNGRFRSGLRERAGRRRERGRRNDDPHGGATNVQTLHEGLFGAGPTAANNSTVAVVQKRRVPRERDPFFYLFRFRAA